MPKTDVLVLGAGIVGVCVALQLAKRGVAVALIDRRGPGEETSYGNAGIIGSAGVYPNAFPRRWSKVLQVALGRAPEANYHLAFLPRVASWLFAYRRASDPRRLEASARALNPLLERSAAEYEGLMLEADAIRYLRKDGWISLYRSADAINALRAELALGEELGVPATPLDVEGARALEPDLAPVFTSAIHWPSVATLSNPLAVTQAFAARFAALGGRFIKGEARSLTPMGGSWSVDTEQGRLSAREAVVALGPWSTDVLSPLGLNFPVGIKRGYHRHYRARGGAALTRPVLDADIGYVLCPMEQGIRLTTGAEFAHRDAKPSPVQFERILPHATKLFPLDGLAEPRTWMGCRPCFPDSLPVIGPAPGQRGLWLAFGHGHMGLSFGPVTGRIMAEMITGAPPFCDPKPYRAERFV